MSTDDDHPGANSSAEETVIYASCSPLLGSWISRLDALECLNSVVGWGPPGPEDDIELRRGHERRSEVEELLASQRAQIALESAYPVVSWFLRHVVALPSGEIHAGIALFPQVDRPIHIDGMVAYCVVRWDSAGRLQSGAVTALPLERLSEADRRGIRSAGRALWGKNESIPIQYVGTLDYVPPDPRETPLWSMVLRTVSVTAAAPLESAKLIWESVSTVPAYVLFEAWGVDDGGNERVLGVFVAYASPRVPSSPFEIECIARVGLDRSAPGLAPTYGKHLRPAVSGPRSAEVGATFCLDASGAFVADDSGAWTLVHADSGCSWFWNAHTSRLRVEPIFVAEQVVAADERADSTSVPPDNSVPRGGRHFTIGRLAIVLAAAGLFAVGASILLEPDSSTAPQVSAPPDACASVSDESPDSAVAQEQFEALIGRKEHGGMGPPASCFYETGEGAALWTVLTASGHAAAIQAGHPKGFRDRNGQTIYEPYPPLTNTPRLPPERKPGKDFHTWDCSIVVAVPSEVVVDSITFPPDTGGSPLADLQFSYRMAPVEGLSEDTKSMLGMDTSSTYRGRARMACKRGRWAISEVDLSGGGAWSTSG